MKDSIRKFQLSKRTYNDTFIDSVFCETQFKRRGENYPFLRNCYFSTELSKHCHKRIVNRSELSLQTMSKYLQFERSSNNVFSIRAN